MTYLSYNLYCVDRDSANTYLIENEHVLTKSPTIPFPDD
jgi:hypothetical protein